MGPMQRNGAVNARLEIDCDHRSCTIAVFRSSTAAVVQHDVDEAK